ncbi:hypothetical protein CC78DRAFT_578161 [Lojkania enalia]|uniref:Uncharacterized protein n=1 Tax=Lojkania enalia TaxID=147567 RepID=A0A9P4N1T7_9PLEO|nr:hypothetical protein CC78DRAFT_578161 [Didymosphaeria enalia]
MAALGRDCTQGLDPVNHCSSQQQSPPYFRKPRCRDCPKFDQRECVSFRFLNSTKFANVFDEVSLIPALAILSVNVYRHYTKLRILADAMYSSIMANGSTCPTGNLNTQTFLAIATTQLWEKLDKTRVSEEQRKLDTHSDIPFSKFGVNLKFVWRFLAEQLHLVRGTSHIPNTIGSGNSSGV